MGGQKHAHLPIHLSAFNHAEFTRDVEKGQKIWEIWMSWVFSGLTDVSHLSKTSLQLVQVGFNAATSHALLALCLQLRMLQRVQDLSWAETL